MAVSGMENGSGRVDYVPRSGVVVILRRFKSDGGGAWLVGHSERRSSWSWRNRM